MSSLAFPTMDLPLLAPDEETPVALPASPTTQASQNAVSDAESSGTWDLVHLVNRIPALRDCVKKGFQDTRVLEVQPNFIENVMKVPDQIILKHAVVVLGPAGAGKTTLVRALAEAGFQPRIEPGPFMENRTLEAQAVVLQIGIQIANKDLEVVLIDTPGWSHDTSTNIKSEYKRILRERQLVSEHTPHIILLCIPVSSIRQFQDVEAERMSKQLHELNRDQRFPIKVLPVATKADSEHLQDRDKLLLTVKELTEKAFQGSGADVEDAVYTMFPPLGFPPGGDADDGVGQVKDRIRAMLTEQINSSQFNSLWQKHFAKSLAEHTMKHCEQFPENDSAHRLHQKAYRTVEAICGREPSSLAKHEPQDVLHLPWENIMEVAERDAVAETAWFYFRATYFGSCRRAVYCAIWLVLPFLIYCISKSMCMEWPLHSIRHSIAWELRYSRYLRSIRVQRRWLAFFLVLLMVLSAMQLHVMEEELSKMAQKNADDMTNKVHTINVSEAQLRVMTMKFGLEKRQADEMTHKNLDLQRQLDVMTKKFETGKRQADEMFNVSEAQLRVMTMKFGLEKRQADEMTHKNLDLQRQLDVMTKKFETGKRQADERFNVSETQLHVMTMKFELEKRQADEMTHKNLDLQRQLDVMTKKFETGKRQADERFNVSETQLRVMTMKFELEKRQADEMTHKNLDLQRQLDVMTKKFETGKRQADERFNVSETQLRVMTMKFELEKRQADEMTHKNLDLQKQLDVMTKKFETGKRQANEMFQKITDMQKQLDVMAQTAEDEKRRADGLAREYDDLTSCTWQDQTTQCLGLFLLGTVNDADACKDTCCKMGQDHCSTWQYDESLGCFVGNPKSCDGNYGHWSGGLRI